MTRPTTGGVPATSPSPALEAVVLALLARGNRLARDGQGDSVFGPSPEGYIAVLEDRLDWEHVQAEVLVPAGISYDPARDVLFDETTWCSVYGSRGEPAAAAG